MDTLLTHVHDRSFSYEDDAVAYARYVRPSLAVDLYVSRRDGNSRKWIVSMRKPVGVNFMQFTDQTT